MDDLSLLMDPNGPALPDGRRRRALSGRPSTAPLVRLAPTVSVQDDGPMLTAGAAIAWAFRHIAIGAALYGALWLGGRIERNNYDAYLAATDCTNQRI